MAAGQRISAGEAVYTDRPCGVYVWRHDMDSPPRGRCSDWCAIVCEPICICRVGESDGLNGEPSDDEAGREWGYIRIYAHYNRYAVRAVYAPCIYEIHGWHYARLSVPTSITPA
nr:hypothetical protein [uncultured Prevotella sp.]